jgi:hypothetical protein
MQAQNATEQEVVKPPIQSSMQRLGLYLQFAVNPTRPDRNVRSSLDRSQQLLCILNGRGIVRVHEEDNIAVRVTDAVADALALSAIDGIVNEMYYRVCCGKSSRNFCCVVSGSIIDNDYLGVPGIGIDKCQNGSKCPWKTLGFVVRRNDDATQWTTHVTMDAPATAAVALQNTPLAADNSGC